MSAPGPIVVRSRLRTERAELLRQLLGVELDVVSAKEKLVSAVGGALAILTILGISHHLLGREGAPMLIASMGASAVLLFGVPHGQLSQPWPVLGGHVAAAAIGVTCARLIPNVELAAACAVGLTIGVMHQLKFIHPPGGATALTAVVGGPAVRSLGYSFVWQPVMLNALTIVGFAVAFNALFAWRRYPAHLARRHLAPGEVPELSHQGIIDALRSIDSFIDITEDDVARLFHIFVTQPGVSTAQPVVPGPTVASDDG